MKLPTPIITFIIASLSVFTKAQDAANNETPKLSLSMSQSIISRNQGILSSSSDKSGILQAGFVQKALTQVLLHHAHPNASSTPLISQFLTKSVNSIVPAVLNASADTILYPLDRLSTGNALISEYHLKTQNATAYKAAFEALRTSIDLQPRTAQEEGGGLWYWTTYPNWSYLDGMYSFAPFLTSYTTQYDRENTTAVRDVVHQLELLWQHCHNETSGLLVHGYDASKTAVWADSSTGASPHVWGRSLGWYLMALLDTLELLPSGTGAPVWQDARRYIAKRFRELSSAVVRSVDHEGSGAWWQILDQPGREGNYIESSGSSMFVYALMKGVRLGLLEDKDGSEYGARGVKNTTYSAVAVRAYEYIRDTFVVDNGNGTLGWNGTVGVCSLNSTATYEYYVGQPILYNSVLGSAAFVLASLEYEHLTKHNI